jgi:hypothetical protein
MGGPEDPVRRYKLPVVIRALDAERPALALAWIFAEHVQLAP